MNHSVSLFCFFYLFTKRGQISGSVSAALSLPVFPALHAGLVYKQAPQTAQPEALTVQRKFQRQSHKDPLILELIIIMCSALHIVKMIILFRGHHLCFASAYFEGLKLVLSNIVERLQRRHGNHFRTKLQNGRCDRLDAIAKQKHQLLVVGFQSHSLKSQTKMPQCMLNNFFFRLLSVYIVPVMLKQVYGLIKYLKVPYYITHFLILMFFSLSPASDD